MSIPLVLNPLYSLQLKDFMEMMIYGILTFPKILLSDRNETTSFDH